MLKGNFMDRTTTGVATVGVTYPAWETQLHHFGEVAAIMVPILSALWLAVQIVAFIIRQIRGTSHHGNLED
jgi:hypothetical protein